MTDDKLVARVLRELADLNEGFASSFGDSPVLSWARTQYRTRAAELEQDAPPSVLDTTPPVSGNATVADAHPSPVAGVSGPAAGLAYPYQANPVGHGVMPTVQPSPAYPAQPQAEAGAGLQEAMEWLQWFVDKTLLHKQKALTILAHIRQQDERIAELKKDLEHSRKYAQQWINMDKQSQSSLTALRAENEHAIAIERGKLEKADADNQRLRDENAALQDKYDELRKWVDDIVLILRNSGHHGTFSHDCLLCAAVISVPKPDAKEPI